MGLLDAIISGDIGRVVITHKDRLLRFGAELVFAICASGAHRIRKKFYNREFFSNEAGGW